jgi:hypothetical protein
MGLLFAPNRFLCFKLIRMVDLLLGATRENTCQPIIGTIAYSSAKKRREVTVGASSKGSNEWFTFEYFNGVATIVNSSGKYISVDPSHNITCK